jgi:hypothetical protein
MSGISGRPLIITGTESSLITKVLGRPALGGAKPGLIMLGNPRVGETYRQEYHKGIAEDVGTILATDAKVTVPHGIFENCLQVKDWNLLKPGAEFKYFCPAVGFLALELEQEGGGGVQRVELVSVSSDASATE